MNILKDYNDYELVYLAQEQNEDALNIIYKKYEPIVYKKCRKYLNFLKGVELCDLIQECNIILLNAIKTYNQDNTTTFYTFITICIDRHLVNLYRKNLNNTKLNNYIYYHKCNMETALQQCPLYYWENEAVKYQPKLTERVDIICSHSAPSFCYPTDKGSIVMEYAQYDETLLEDIQKERETLDLIYNDYKDEITHWYYGHFHQSMFQEINNVKFRLLDIGELIQHVDDNYIW